MPTPSKRKSTGSQNLLGFARRVGLAMVLQSVGAGLAFAMQVLLARWMHAESYGVYSYSFAWASLIAVVGGLGLPTAVLRFIPSYRAMGDHARLSGVIRASLGATLGVGMAVWLIATLALCAYSLLGGGSVHPHVILVLLLAPLIAVMTLQTEVIRAFHRVILAYVPSLVGRPLFVILGAGSCLAITGKLSATTVLLIITLGIGLLVLAQGLIFWRGLKEPIRRSEPTYEVRDWMRVALPLLLLAGFGIVLSQADVILIGLLRGAEAAGLYTAASKSANLVGLVLVAVNAISTPALSAQFARGEHEQMQELASRAAALAFWPSAALSAVLTVAAGPILGLFGDQFSAAAPVLIVLLIGQLVNAAAGSVGYIMIVAGQQLSAVRVYGWVTVLHLLMTPLAIIAFGSVGAAAVTSFTLATWNIALTVLTARKVGIRTSILPSL